MARPGQNPEDKILTRLDSFDMRADPARDRISRRHNRASIGNPVGVLRNEVAIDEGNIEDLHDGKFQHGHIDPIEERSHN